MNDDERQEKVRLFIKLAGELLSEDSLRKMAPILLKDCHVLIEPGLCGADGMRAKIGDDKGDPRVPDYGYLSEEEDQ